MLYLVGKSESGLTLRNNSVVELGNFGKTPSFIFFLLILKFTLSIRCKFSIVARTKPHGYWTVDRSANLCYEIGPGKQNG
jgi:hypothetical protein